VGQRLTSGRSSVAENCTRLPFSARSGQVSPRIPRLVCCPSSPDNAVVPRDAARRVAIQGYWRAVIAIPLFVYCRETLHATLKPASSS
jgi:hypothetical protein